MARRDPRLRAFVKYDKNGDIVPGSLILRRKPPESGRSYFWQEVTENTCCSQPLSNWDYFDGSTSDDGIFQITVNGSIVAYASNTASDTFAAGAGQTVVVTVTGTGPTKTLLVVDDTSGVVLSNQTGTTGTLTYTYTAPGGHIYTIVATQNEITTTTTTTTSTSTTSTTTTSTTSTSTSTTTTSTTTGAAGSFTVTNAHSVPAGVTITDIGPDANFTGGTYPVTAGTSTVSTISVAGTASINFTVGASGLVGSATANLYKNGALQETLGVITAPGTYTFGAISFLTTDRLQIILN